MTTFVGGNLYILNMHRIIYLSSAEIHFSEEEIISLLKKSRLYNIQRDITGMLIYIDGNFLQVLEGDKKEVINLYEKIKEDCKHKGLICVFDDQTENRQFPDWSMGFCSSKYDILRKMSGYENFDKKKFFNISDKTVFAFIDTFIKSQRDKIDFV